MRQLNRMKMKRHEEMVQKNTKKNESGGHETISGT
jgi:hypothetical protein